MDPENSIIKLCVQGMDFESQGDFQTALRLFLCAWEQSTDDFQRCIAAHYVARHQKAAEDALLWNQRSFDCATAINDERVSGFLPSLCLNLGKAYEDLGRRHEARRFYGLAAELLNSLPNNEYGQNVRHAIDRALERVP